MKRNGQRRIAILVMAVAALVAAPLLQAHPEGPRQRERGMRAQGRQQGPGLLNRRVLRRLEVTEEQATRIRGIFTELRETNAPLRRELREGREGVAQALIQTPGEIDAAQALIERQAKAQQTLRTNALKATAKAMTVLTAEQRAELAEIVARRGERRGF